MVETEELKLIETAQKCVDKGLHVHIDKPAGGNVDDFERLLNTAKSKNLTVQIGYMYRYNPAVQYCWNAVKNGELGKIYQVDAIMNSWYSPEKREWKIVLAKYVFLGLSYGGFGIAYAGSSRKDSPFEQIQRH